MPDELGSPPKVGGIIPHFWFDVIGRFVPGAYFLISCFALAYRNSQHNAMVCWLLGQVPAHLFAAFVMFFISSYFVGFYTGSVAYWFTERFLLQWFCPRRLEEIPKSAIEAAKQRFGSELFNDAAGRSGHGLTDLFRMRIDWFRARTKQHSLIVKVAGLCAHIVWAENPILGVILSKRDSEALASRSVFFESLVLVFIARVIRGDWACAWIFIPMAFVAMLNYSHYRRRQALDPLGMLLAISPRTATSKN